MCTAASVSVAAGVREASTLSHLLRSRQRIPCRFRTGYRTMRDVPLTSTTIGGKPTVLGYDQGKVASDGLLVYGRGAGGVVSTAEDVDRFYRHLLAGDLLPLKLVHDMARPTGTIPFGIGQYGLGLWIWPIRCDDGIGHSGSGSGFATKAWTIQTNTDRWSCW